MESENEIIATKTFLFKHESSSVFGYCNMNFKQQALLSCCCATLTLFTVIHNPLWNWKGSDDVV
jgi:hypothetical protein